MDKSIINHIAASLEYGNISGKAVRTFLTVVLVLTFLTIPATIAAGIFLNTVYFAGFLFAGIVLPALIYAMVRCGKSVKRVLPFLEDAVELTVSSKKTDSYTRFNFAKGINDISTLCRIQIKFEYKKRKIIKNSGAPGVYEPTVYNARTGYARIFNEYTNRDIRILYSPKYDQILILKDNAVAFNSIEHKEVDLEDDTSTAVTIKNITQENADIKSILPEPTNENPA